MEEIKYTPAQTAAIEDRGGTLLVSAAAGSGKTKVLVERLMRRVAEEGADIRDFLIITYTRAAAAELRGKILDDITDRSAKEPGNRHLRRQSAMIYRADIGTIHSFCGRIIRENAHVLDINPDFRMADDAESDMIRRQALEDALNKRYDKLEEFEGFSLLTDTLSAGRDDANLVETVLETHAKLQSHPYPDRWAREQLSDASFEGFDDASETVWGKYLLNRAKLAVDFWAGELEAAMPEIEGDEALKRGYGECFWVMLDWLRRFQEAVMAGWDEAHSCGNLTYPKARGRVSGFERIKDMRRRCAAELKKITSVFDRTSAEIFEDIKETRPAAEALVRLVLDFDRAYAEEKERRGLLDFSDLEHMAVKLLIDGDSGERTDTARELSRRYTEVLVDEFQDVNRTQDMIFRAVSAEGGGLFMVGDVKQSIYRFRLADPGIFLKYYKNFPDAAEEREGSPRKISLSANFRSGEGILEAVNFVFSRIMSESFGEMDYTEREYLNAGRELPPGTEPEVELDIVDLYKCPRENEVNKSEIVPKFVAKRISQLIVSGEYTCDDIVILLRSTRDKARLYERALSGAGIPAVSDREADFFAEPEVAVIIALLNIIDNPIQDVPLIAVLRSPLYGFTPDELAGIRQEDPEGSFYDALCERAETDEKCRDFLSELTHFRTAAPDYTADKFLWHVLSRTDALRIFGAMDRGDGRRENLMLLFEHARRYEGNGYRGPFGFISLIRKMMERGKPIEVSAKVGSGKVRIMSIHKSKGLEFPVVFLADLGKSFNLQDTKKHMLIHPQLGIGTERRDARRKIHYPTMPRTAISEKMREETLAEELRILYVGMTRPQSKLVMVCKFDNAETKLMYHSQYARLPIPPHVLGSASSMADWIMTAALMRSECGCLLADAPQCEKTEGVWSVNMIHWSKILEEEQAGCPEQKEEAPPTAPNPEDIEIIEARLGFKYPYERVLGLPSKLTATELKGKGADTQAMEDARPIVKEERRIVFERPSFIKEDRPLTGAERGTATHLVMQYIDFEKCRDLPGIRGEIARLEEKMLLTSRQAAAVRPEVIERFFRSETGQRALKADSLTREFKFSLLIPAELYYEGAGEEKILLQGVIDCYFEEDGKLTIIDFKTDYVNEDTILDRARQYKGQQGAYSYALERICGKEVEKKILYFFTLDRAVEL